MTKSNYTDTECREAFVHYMNVKAKLLGMDSTYYYNASGLTTKSYSTPIDALKLGFAVTSNSNALQIWHAPNRQFMIGGGHSRKIVVINNNKKGEIWNLEKKLVPLPLLLS